MSIITQMLMTGRKDDESPETKQIINAIDRYGEWQGATATISFLNDLLVNKFANVLSNKSSKEEFERRLAALQVMKLEREMNATMRNKNSKEGLDEQTLAAIVTQRAKLSPAAQKVFARIGMK